MKRSTTEADAQQLTGPVHTDHDLVMTICTGHIRIGTSFIIVLKADHCFGAKVAWCMLLLISCILQHATGA